MGFIDKPFEQLRELLLVELAGTGGHVGIAGGPRSGKSTLLRTVICSLALTQSPRDVQFYCLDFGGGALGSIADLPHVGNVCGRLDVDRVTRTIAEITALIAARERRFTQLGVDNMATYRRMRADGRVTDDPLGDVFLVVDGWFTLRQEFEALDGAIRHIAAQGLGYGVHLLLAANRWSDVHHAMRDQIGTRLELRLGDPVDSTIDLRLAATVPNVPGRGLTVAKLHFLAALPRIDGIPDPTTVAEGARALATAVRDFWPGEPAAPIRILPAVLPPTSLPAPEGDLRLAIGLDRGAHAADVARLRGTAAPHRAGRHGKRQDQLPALRRPLGGRSLHPGAGPHHVRRFPAAAVRCSAGDVPTRLLGIGGLDEGDGRRRGGRSAPPACPART